MPIEIRELHIKAVIDGSKSSGNNNPAAPGSKAPQQGATEGGNMDSIIDACVEKVLEILKDQKER